jgi:succinate dehydrogenase / fumarate reductase cytochrome b subunit
VMGFILEIKNNKAREIKYAKNKGGANSSWMSRNMIWSGLAILSFMALHFVDFWFPEINIKYIQGDMSGMHNGEFRYFEELVEKFHNPVRVVSYCLGFIFLSLHLLHGFNSAFQSVGANNKYTKGLKQFSKIYAIGIPLGFIFIALFHHLQSIL